MGRAAGRGTALRSKYAREAVASDDLESCQATQLRASCRVTVNLVKHRHVITWRCPVVAAV